MNLCETQQFYLFVEPPAQAIEPVPVGPGISCVTAKENRLNLVAAAADSPEDAFLIEPVTNRHGQPRLLLINPPHARTRVNGIVTPPVAVLKERDVVQFPEGLAAHVCVRHRPRVGAPPPGLLGRECPVCRVTFTAESKCYQCGCGAGLHLEDRPDGLQCVQTRTECVCGRPIILQEGFSYQPDLNHA